jgi:hypothetical protein
MKVEALLVANGASIENSLLNVAGAGWEHFQAPLLPFTVRGALCGIMTMDNQELGSVQVMRIEVNDEKGRVEPSVGTMTIDASRGPTSDESVPMRFPFFAPLMFVVRGATIVKATLSSDGEELATTSFVVKEPVPDTLPSG